MKHVREELPDVQRLRPEVSAALAAVIDRATAKDLARRYASDAELIADLEDVLAIETARAGSASGEATTVLRTLPPRARRRLPHAGAPIPRWLAVAALVAVAAAVGLAVLLSGHTERGTGTQGAARAQDLVPISLKQSAAKDYDPYGTGGEHPEQTGLVVDRDNSTFWTTERYDGGLGSKPGVGIYVDAAPSVEAKSLQIRTPEPGFTAAVYAADSGPAQGHLGLDRRRARSHGDRAERQLRPQLVGAPPLLPRLDHQAAQQPGEDLRDLPVQVIAGSVLALGGASAVQPHRLLDVLQPPLAGERPAVGLGQRVVDRLGGQHAARPRDAA